MTKGKLPRLRVVSGDPGPEAGDEGVQLAAQAGSIQAALRVGQAQSTSQAQLTGSPAGRLGFVGQHEKINVYLRAVVDPDAFREDTQRREAELQRQIEEKVGNTQDVADQTPRGHTTGGANSVE